MILLVSGQGLLLLKSFNKQALGVRLIRARLIRAKEQGGLHIFPAAIELSL